jgi:hypothetical protein
MKPVSNHGEADKNKQNWGAKHFYPVVNLTIVWLVTLYDSKKIYTRVSEVPFSAIWRSCYDVLMNKKHLIKKDLSPDQTRMSDWQELEIPGPWLTACS